MSSLLPVPVQLRPGGHCQPLCHCAIGPAPQDGLRRPPPDRLEVPGIVVRQRCRSCSQPWPVVRWCGMARGCVGFTFSHTCSQGMWRRYVACADLATTAACVVKYIAAFQAASVSPPRPRWFPRFRVATYHARAGFHADPATLSVGGSDQTERLGLAWVGCAGVCQ